MTYEQALAGAKKKGAAKCSDAENMAAVCEGTAQILCGAVSPKLIWEGAMKKGMTGLELVKLMNDDPHAAGELMWV